MTNDISRQTIVVLVILAVLISLLGTWTVLTEVSRVRVRGSNVASADVRLTILPPEKAQPQEPEVVSTTGMVAFRIIEPPVKG
ncbi:hypothetical protein J7K74_01670 [Candidatus Woesearchaeota archaeon]|nr:hypothetical protein [Candidatus Woesearchaeota archaeon]